MSATAGYSGKPLAAKLGIRPGQALAVVNAPPHYADLVAPLPEGVRVVQGLERGAEITHMFVRDRADLAGRVAAAVAAIAPGCALWVSWPKRGSRGFVDLTEAGLRELLSPLDLALQIMARAHAGQVDKAGRPYVLHPIRVMMRLATQDEQVVALLHDVVEDSEVTLEDLRAWGFSPAVVAAVGRLTKLEGESYEDFISRVMTDPLASRVKIADLSENIDLTRLREVGATDLARVAKYHGALSRLTAAWTLEPAVSTP